jgi:hypothetical protein
LLSAVVRHKLPSPTTSDSRADTRIVREGMGHDLTGSLSEVKRIAERQPQDSVKPKRAAKAS